MTNEVFKYMAVLIIYLTVRFFFFYFSVTVTGMGKDVHRQSGGCGLYNSTQILSNARIHPHLRYIKYMRGKTKAKAFVRKNRNSKVVGTGEKLRTTQAFLCPSSLPQSGALASCLLTVYGQRQQSPLL